MLKVENRSKIAVAKILGFDLSERRAEVSSFGNEIISSGVARIWGQRTQGLK
jgi:hypothetical protein